MTNSPPPRQVDSRTFSHALNIQCRVLWALCLREIHGLHGKFKIGYLWQIIRVIFSVAVFWWIREIGHFRPPQGLSTPIFLLMGFVPWYIFAESVDKVMEAVRTNRALLTFPQVTPLDLYVSSGLVIAATQCVVLALSFAVLYLMGYTITMYSPMIFLLVLIGSALLGLGFGLVMSALNFYIPVLEKLVPMVLRILFFASGVFFSPTQVAARFGDIVMWLPTANYIELLRGVFISPAPAEAASITYVGGLTLIFLALGLLLERHVRPLQEVT